jgi:hypothetical protein
MLVRRSGSLRLTLKFARGLAENNIKRDVSELRGDMQEVRQHQERDLRILFSALIGVALGLAGLMAKGFGWFH